MGSNLVRTLWPVARHERPDKVWTHEMRALVGSSLVRTLWPVARHKGLDKVRTHEIGAHVGSNLVRTLLLAARLDPPPCPQRRQRDVSRN